MSLPPSPWLSLAEAIELVAYQCRCTLDAAEERLKEAVLNGEIPAQRRERPSMFNPGRVIVLEPGGPIAWRFGTIEIKRASLEGWLANVEVPKQGAVEQPQKSKRRPGRRKGQGSYAEADAPLVEQMHQMIEEGRFSGPWPAAQHFADQAVGHGQFEHKAKRLLGRYSEKFGE